MSIRDRWLSKVDGGVVCIACGRELRRSDAREYDKHGDRWDRAGKQFEYLCKPCYSEYSHQPRKGLEALLVDAGAGTVDRNSFLRRYCELANQETSSG